MKLKRRDFVKKSMVVSAGVALGAPSYIKGYAQTKPSEAINVAVIGLNSRGGTAIEEFTKIKDTRITALCDCVSTLFPASIKQLEDLGATNIKPTQYVDYRKLMEDKDVDVVSIATPGYWHAIHTITAIQGGKDVYCEKPMTYSVEEGRRVVDFARKYNKIVQVGLQHHSERIFHKAVEMVKSGVIGDIYMGRGTVYRQRGNIGRVANSAVPEGCNWDLFRGPAPMIPFNMNHYLYNWHWYWDTTTTEFGNNGIHVMDRIRVLMGKTFEHPVQIACTGGFYAYDSDQEVPNLQVGTYKYADGKVMELEVRSLPNPGNDDFLLLGTKGYATLSGSAFNVYVPAQRATASAADIAAAGRAGTAPAAQQAAPAAAPAARPAAAPAAAGAAAAPAAAAAPRTQSAPVPTIAVTSAELPIDAELALANTYGVDVHFLNFVNAVKSRKREDLQVECEIGHYSTAQIHLGNIAYRTQRTLNFDGKTEKFINDADANTYLTRKDGYRSPYILPKLA